MSGNTSQLHRLIDLAKEPSSDKRRELLREVTDLFLQDPPSFNGAVREHFGAILSQVAGHMDVTVREHLAEQFASIAAAPHELIRQLANDEFSVAKEVLAKSTVLSDADLVDIARRRSQGKLTVIACRPSVSETVSEAIVEHASDDVVVKLVTNAGAKVSRPTLHRVVDRSRSCEALQAPLVTRTDVPGDMLHDMFMFVSSELRSKITQKLDSLPPDVVDQAFAEAARNFSAGMRQQQQADRRAMAYIRELASRKALNEQLLHQLLRSKQNVEFIHAFAALADVDIQTVRRTVDTRNTEGLAIICKAARFDRTTFSAIALLIGETAKRSAQQTNEMLALYDKVTPESAQRVMRFWRVRKEAVDAPITLAQAG